MKCINSFIYYFKNISALKINRVKKIKKIESIIQRLEKKFVGMPLDIEFLIYKRKVYILQLRKLKTYYTENINFKKRTIN